MFERVGQLAEQAATNLSRRDFLARLSQAAAGAAGALGGLLLTLADAQAARKPKACGASSAAACQGLNVGDPCIDAGIDGRCVEARPKACGCVQSFPK